MFRSIFNRSKSWSIVVLLGLATLTTLGTSTRVWASVAAVNGFSANCATFSVDITMQGVTDDGGGFDKFRYMVIDGSGNTLYTEDSARQTGISDRGAVINLAYNPDDLVAGRPVQNPITFKVIDLDANTRPGATLQEVTYNAPCLAPSDKVSAPDNFLSLVKTEGKLVENTALYYAPGSTFSTGLNAASGNQLSIVYRSSDDQWLGVLVSPQDMVWVPASAIKVDLFDIPIQPKRIDPSQSVTGALVPTGNPVGTGLAFYSVQLRAAPNARATSLGVIPFNTTLTIYGRNAQGTWYKVSYNGVVGWVAGWNIRLNNLRRLSLPIVE